MATVDRVAANEAKLKIVDAHSQAEEEELAWLQGWNGTDVSTTIGTLERDHPHKDIRQRIPRGIAHDAKDCSVLRIDCPRLAENGAGAGCEDESDNEPAHES